MTKRKKHIIVSFLIAFVMLMGTMINVYAAGTETFPIGSHNINGFTFTNNNLTPVKTMPNGVQKLVLGVKFRKAATDKGIGQVKLTIQIRDITGRVVTQKIVDDTSYNFASGYTTFVTDPISVSGGQKYQIFFDASSTGQSNGNFRTIEIGSFYSFINMNTIVW